MRNSLPLVGNNFMFFICRTWRTRSAVEHINTINIAIEAGFMPLSSSERVTVNTSRNSSPTFLGLVALTHANNNRQVKSKAVVQCSVVGKRKLGLIFMHS